MALARVELRDSLTYNVGNRLFKKHKAELITDSALIEKLANTKGFSVTVLEESSIPPPAMPNRPVGRPKVKATDQPME